MSSARRPRTVNRRSTKGNETAAPVRDDDAPERTKQKKLKLSDLLGPPWSEEDLKCFYEAYRQHGKDWRKISSMVDNRTLEMVEYLYNMNKAYLSLPEGAASAAGLIAMMTDHYNMLGDSRSDKDESSRELTSSETSPQIPPQSRNKRGGSYAPQVVSGLSSYGGPSPAKKPRSVAANRPRIVGKRTPRVPIANLKDKKPKGQAWSLASSSQRVSSPQVSRKPAAAVAKNSPARNGSSVKEKRNRVELGSSVLKHTGSNLDNGALDEESQESKGEVKSKQKRGQKNHPRKSKLQAVDESCRFEDVNEEFSCTDEGTGKYEEEAGDTMDMGGTEHKETPKKKRQTPQRNKKRNRQLFSGEESSGLDALATLADLTLNGFLTSPRLDSEPTSEFIDEIKEEDSLVVPELKLRKMKEQEVRPSEDMNEAWKRKLMDSDVLKMLVAKDNDESAVDKDLHQTASTADLRRRKRKGPIDKLNPLKISGSGDLPSKVQAASANEDVKAHGKTKRIGTPHNVIKPTYNKAATHDDTTSLLDKGSGAQECFQEKLEEEPLIEGQKVTALLKQNDRRKLNSERLPEVAVSDVLQDGEEAARGAVSIQSSLARKENCPHSSSDSGTSSFKVALTHCLSSAKVRKWCNYEWFNSAIDLPWFAENEFVQYLNHAGLGHVPRLTRVEWTVIRNSLGKPRRLSSMFLQEERRKLELYRQNVRSYYDEVRIGQRDGLANDLPRPLSVGQHVIAHHPKIKGIHDGSILTVDRNRCRVQFDRPELGVEFVSDIDVMPVNAFENLSESLIRQSMAVDIRVAVDSKSEMKSKAAVSAGIPGHAVLNERIDKPGMAPSNATTASSRYSYSALCQKVQVANTVDAVMQVKEAVTAAERAIYNHSSLSQVQVREADIKALADLARALDKKEALLVELRNMNDDADQMRKDGQSTSSQIFQKQYATVLLQLKEVNSQVAMALVQLRHRNKYQENTIPPWHYSSQQLTSSGGLVAAALPSLDPATLQGSSEQRRPLPNLERRPPVNKLSLMAKQNARLMVATAMQAISTSASSSAYEGGGEDDALSKIGFALRSLPKPTIPGQMGHSSLSFPCESTVIAVEDAAAADATKLLGSANATEASCLMDLISSCVASLFMVQVFTELQFLPADVASVLDSILLNLRPQAAQNHVVYQEIEECMSVLKNQIVTLMPKLTTVNVPCPAECPPSN